MAYDNKTKYKIIEEVCNGKTASDIQREYGIIHNTTMKWLRIFAENGPFKGDKLTPKDYAWLERLQESAKKRELELRKHGTTINESFEWLLEYDQNLVEWKAFTEEWIKTVVRGKDKSLNALSNFFKKYIIAMNLTRSVQEFVSTTYEVPDFYESIYSERGSQRHAFEDARMLISFIDWILEEKFSVEDDYGNKLIPAEFRNPLEQYLPDHVARSNKSESDKNVLPYRYIKELRNLLVPSDATCFRDLTLAQELTDWRSSSGDWYIVDRHLIDKNDPDCVFRKRKATTHEIKTKGYSEYVYEMWCPAKTICLLTKLMLPIRTYQARMLDSGEMDTFKYVQKDKYKYGEWVINDSPLSQGTKSKPCEKGVLRKFIDPTTNLEMTGFFINTNKTADINKDEADKGYNMPWQYEEMQYWLAKLRDWQQKYNPISKPTAWTELTKSQLGAVKDIKILKAMGNAAFLFRDAANDKNYLPLAKDIFLHLWYKLLKCLEQKENQNSTTQAVQNLKFVREDSDRYTYYPLHSLRVSLITAFALEGGVPMPVLSKCIAGHARLVMTLYYTKMGISYITDTMKKADTEILKQDQESFERFIRDAKYKQLEIGAAVNDTAAYNAVLSAQKSKASIVMSDKGICPKGCFGCDTGGTYVNDDTDKVTYGPVQGYPAHNCVRCRWFITGPAFLPGLVNHFNVLSYEMAETSKRVTRYQNETEELENSKYEAEQHGEIFEQYEDLLKYEQLLQQELQKGDDIANNLNATLRLIDKCHKISKSGNDNDSSSTQLVPVGTVQDVGFLLEAEADEMHQLQAICNGAELFPETDASKALLKRSQIIDMTLMFNKKQPVMFTLSEEEQLLAGNQFMRLLIKRAGSLKEAIPYAIGRKKLEEIGIHNEFEKELKIMRYDAPLKLLSTNNDA
jgi:transposase-like protein